MKIQLTPERIVKGAQTVWQDPGPNVDIAMDIKNLTFRAGSINEIFAFHVLDHLFPGEVDKAIQNWRQCLAPGGKLYVTVDDFEYLARAFVGGDLTIELMNDMHNHPTQFTRDSLIADLKRAGFGEDYQRIWFESIPDLFPKQHYELVIEAEKHEG